VALRGALGASRGRLVRQLFTESLLLAAAGSALGLLLAWWGTHALVALAGSRVPRASSIGLDAQVLAFTGAIALATALAFGLLPVIQASSTDLQATLKAGGRSATGGPRSRLVRNGLVFLEVAMALVLLAGAGLLLRSWSGIVRTDPGFEPQGLLTLRLTLPHSRYAEGVQQVALFDALQRRIQALPGVKSAGVGTPLPLSGETSVHSYEIEGRHPARPQDALNADLRMVDADYLATLRVPRLRGRGLAASDDARAPAVALISRTIARRMFPNEDPIGKRFTFGSTWRTIVGVVGDVRGDQIVIEPRGEIYLPMAQWPVDSAALVVRTDRDPQLLAGPVREAVRQLDPELAVWKVQPMEGVVADSIAGQRFNTVLFALFAAIAVLLAAAGVYGVISYSVGQRTPEIGIRLALGASPATVMRMVLEQGMRPVAGGIVTGLAGALAAGRLLDSLLYGISSHDPLTLVGTPAFLATIGLLAIYLPGRRATQIDPLVALRHE
jgi:putative ABC transport system permease protein